MKKLFASIKPIIVLLVIMLFSGSTLAILNDVLFVTPEVRTQRAIQNIYGYVPDYQTILDVDTTDQSINNQQIEYENYGKIQKIYLITGEQKEVLFKAVGTKGYNGGNITLWVKVVKTDNKYVIDKVILESFTKQTLMSKLDGKYYGYFKNIDVTDAYNNQQWLFSNSELPSGNGNIPVSGATLSATAGCNAINCVIKYLGENALWKQILKK